MAVIKRIFIGIPVYNEENTILKCLDSIYEALKLIKNIDYNVILCFNGTNDNSKKIVNENISKYKKLKIIKSEKGKTKAINEIIKNSLDFDIGIFMDSDALMDKKCVINIINHFAISKNELKCITGNPIPITKTFISKIINIRRIYPQSQIPPKSFKNFENKRNYIHGRIYSLKNDIFNDILNSSFQYSKGDDTYLSYFLIKNYGRKSFIELENVNVYYIPVLSLKGWWYKHTRIWSDISNLNHNETEFTELIPYMGCKIDWNYVSKQKTYVKLYFIFERILTYSGKFIFNITSKFINYGWKRIDETKK